MFKIDQLLIVSSALNELISFTESDIGVIGVVRLPLCQCLKWDGNKTAREPFGTLHRTLVA